MCLVGEVEGCRNITAARVDCEEVFQHFKESIYTTVESVALLRRNAEITHSLSLGKLL